MRCFYFQIRSRSDNYHLPSFAWPVIPNPTVSSCSGKQRPSHVAESCEMAGGRFPATDSTSISRCSTRQWGCRRARCASPFLSSPPKVTAAKLRVLIGYVKGKLASPWCPATWTQTSSQGCTWRCKCASNGWGAKPRICVVHCWLQAGSKGGCQVSQDGTEQHQIVCLWLQSPQDPLGNRG